ncbi:MAG: hypothetical protein IK137_00450 [Bacilli bacterium]|nr:hypothetical protein [Bacilli bacterium]
MKLNQKQARILSSTLTVFSIFMIGSGIVLNIQNKPIVNTKYVVSVEKKKIAEAQAKTDEIKVKDLEIEINNPISVNIKDYLDNIEKLQESTIKQLKLDTSLVNINQAGTYKYTITYGKKKYIGNIKVKEKELPNVTLTLKSIKLKTKESLSSNPRTFIEGEITDEVYNNLTLDISKVDTQNQGDYTYYIIYKGVTYQGKVEVRDPGPTIIAPESTTTCPNDAKLDGTTCKCNDENKEYDKDSKKCIEKQKEEVTQ